MLWRVDPNFHNPGAFLCKNEVTSIAGSSVIGVGFERWQILYYDVVDVPVQNLKETSHFDHLTQDTWESPGMTSWNGTDELTSAASACIDRNIYTYLVVDHVWSQVSQIFHCPKHINFSKAFQTFKNVYKSNHSPAPSGASSAALNLWKCEIINQNVWREQSGKEAFYIFTAFITKYLQFFTEAIFTNVLCGLTQVTLMLQGLHLAVCKRSALPSIRHVQNVQKLLTCSKQEFCYCRCLWSFASERRVPQP